MVVPKQFVTVDDGMFPNNKLPVLYFKHVLKLPNVLPGIAVKKRFSENGWGNNWQAGIFSYHHYHSNTHEVLGVIDGSTIIQLGGDEGVTLEIKKGDVLVI